MDDRTGSYPWTLKLESVASNLSPKEAMDSLAEISKRLGIACEGDINGEAWIVFPDGTRGCVGNAVPACRCSEVRP